MTDKELVERLRLNANCMMDEWEPTLCKRSEFITAADRIEQLHAELTNERIDNTNLIGELATVTAERDRYKAVHENPQPLTLEEVKEHITKGHPNDIKPVPFPVSWTVKMKKKQKETQDILSYHTQAAGCSDKARAKASGGRQPIEECGRTGL